MVILDEIRTYIIIFLEMELGEDPGFFTTVLFPHVLLPYLP
jgi:hypothetical protein